MVRRANRVIFTNTTEEIVVGDKAGDVYSFSIKNPTEDGKLLMGHLSMLLDIVS